MFINAVVFINSSVVYKLRGGRGGGGGRGGEGSWDISSRLPTPLPPPPPPLALGQVRDLRISGFRA